MHQAVGLAEAAGGVGEHEVAVVGQVLGLPLDVVLGPAEPVGQQHRRVRALPVGYEGRGVQGDLGAVGLGADLDPRLDRVGGGVGAARRAGDQAEGEGRSDEEEEGSAHRPIQSDDR